MLALALLLSLIGLAVGPLLVAVGRGRAVPSAIVEGLTLGLVPVLLVVQLLPHVYHDAGPLSLVLVAVGYGGLWWADRRHGHRVQARFGRAVIVPALALHALTDGAGLAVAVASARTSGSAGMLLGMALLLHRLPEGLFLTTTLVPELGWRRTLARLAVVAAATVAGAAAGQVLLARVDDRIFDGAVALGLGAMLRLVLHSHSPRPRSSATRCASGVSFALGIAAALALPSPDSVLTRAQPRELSLVQSLLPLFVETAPSMLLGLMAAGLVRTLLPRQAAGWLRRDPPLVQATRGLLFGLPLPVCSCGVLPLTRRLLAAGVPTAAVVAFALATPELGVDSAVVSLRLLGAPLTATRVVSSVVVSISVALLVARSVPRARIAPGAANAGRGAAPRYELRVPERPARRFSLSPLGPREPVAAPPAPLTPGVAPRIRASIVEAFGPTLDHVAAWYVVGLIAAAAFEAAVDPATASRFGSPLDVVLSAVLAVPMSVCAQGATPLAAVMIHKGFSVGAALTFLIVGPATNLAVLGVFRRALGWRPALVLVLGTVACASATGLLANRFVGSSAVPEIHPLVAHDHMRIEWVCAAVLFATLTASLLRLGPRQWFAAMLSDASEDPSAAPTPRAHQVG